jgi:hypothetical protein
VEAQREKQNAENAAAAKAAGWPALTGTKRQVAWAETIRANAVAELRKDAAWWSEKYPEAPGDPLPFIETAMLSQSSASWWIDHRDGLGAASASLTGVYVAESLGQTDALVGPARLPLNAENQQKVRTAVRPRLHADAASRASALPWFSLRTAARRHGGVRAPLPVGR